MSKPLVHIRLLGGLAVDIDGDAVPPVAWRRRHGAALVALLALAPNRRLHRELVIDALWPELSVAEAAPRLHKAAHHARRALGVPDSVVVRAETLTLLPDASVAVDALDFEIAADAALSEGSAAAAEATMPLYGGELLPELPFEPWTEEPRGRLRLRALQLLRQAGQWDDLVAADPTDEEAHVEVMRTLYDSGSFRAVLHQFERLEQILRREIGVEPGPAAVELRDRAIAAAAASTDPVDDDDGTASRRLGNLPRPTDALFGRDADLANLVKAIDADRIVTLAGPGGVGKTRLAVEFAHGHTTDCVFVDLSRVTDPGSVGAAILGALGASPRSRVPDIERIVETLELRSLLLILDSCEHVVEAAAEIAGRIARDTVNAHVLTTSRETLGITGEHVLVIAPLHLPAANATTEEQRASDAVRMFCERAERAGGVIDDLDAVVELTSQLDGIPLALELAAARSRTFSPAQILGQLDEGWSVTAARRASGPAHHVSLDEAIDWSYRLLDEPERSLLRSLSTFHGPFDLAATAAVADLVPMRAADLLARLVDKSLVQSAPGRAGRRLRLLDTVRRFAAARTDPAAATVARDRHAAHFASRVSRLGATVPGPNEDDALVQLAVEFDDIAAAFSHAADRGDVETAARLAVGPRLSLSAEGARWAHLALLAVDLPGIEAEPQFLSIVGSAAWAAVLLGDLERARSLARRGIEIAGDPTRDPRLCWIWPQATGDSFAAGVQCCLDGARLAHEADDPGAESFLLATAAIYGLVVGDEPRSAEAAREALGLAHTVGSRSLQARAAGALAYALQEIDGAGARRAAAEVLDVAPPGDFHLNMPYRVLAQLAWREGNGPTAADHAIRAAELIRDQGDRYVQAAAMRQLAAMIGEVDTELATELLGVADGIVPGITVVARDAAADARLRERSQTALGADRFATLLQRGRRADAAAAFAAVLRAIERIRETVPPHDASPPVQPVAEAP